ncbi:hypothetical protein JMJ55_27480 [Belnapia sp. T6]|uniref:Chromosome partitioning ATPase, Mrp family, contains Fe-S cluster n=1 Tax=Belnapia mucosa TaxID=2804532 RepID=A0ABS1VBM7_9PROT|nr:tyrosine-protein kinase domain-containing protein [Belnapia mucosa]MBL6459074.1 hypothetical protein [Belnapia mucosa]
MNHLQLLSILRRRKGLILVTACFGGLLVGLAAFAVPPSFTATAEIIITHGAVASRGMQSSANATPPEATVIDAHLAMLGSEANLCRVLDKLAVSSGPAQDVQPDWPEVARAWVTARLAALRHLLGFQAAPNKTESAQPADSCSHSIAGLPSLEQLKRRLLIFPRRTSPVIAVSYTDRDPRQASVVVNAIVNDYVNGQRDLLREQSGQRIDWFAQQLSATDLSLATMQETLQRERVRNGGASGSDELEALADARQQRDLAQSESARRRAALDRARGLQRSGGDTRSFAEALGIAVEGRTEPQLAADIADAIGRLDQEAEVSRLQAEAIEAQLDVLQQALERRSDELTAQNTLEQRIARELRRSEQLLRGQLEAKEQQQLTAPPVTIVALARPPRQPSSISPILLLVPGTVAFAFLGAAIAAVRERMDRSFRSCREVEQSCGIECVGLVPEMPRTRGADPAQGLARPSTMRAIRSVLVGMLPMPHADHGSKVVLVTSSLPGEGRTLLATSLAACAARLGQRVLMIDLDCGGCDAVVAREGAGHRIRRNPEFGFDVLSPGKDGMDLLAVLAGGRGDQFLQPLRASYGCIIIDGPAALTVPEAQLLAALVDEVLLAIRWGHTRREVVENTLLLLGRGGATQTKLRTVLTRVDLRKYALYRFGDAGEFLARQGGHAAARPSGAALPGWSADAERHAASMAEAPEIPHEPPVFTGGRTPA